MIIPLKIFTILSDGGLEKYRITIMYLFDEDISLYPNLERRIRNLALGPTTPSNALVPIYEAVYNSIHAISDRFGEDWCKSGRIVITLLDFNGSHPSVQIHDNGIGLNIDNFRSFREYDSSWKVSRGGKGVGRLSWLKVFDHAKISSTFLKSGIPYTRNFLLVADNREPIIKYNVDLSSNSDIGTTITLSRMRPDYVRHMPNQINTVIRKIVAHFLPYLISEDVPSIYVESESGTINLRDFIRSKQIKIGHDVIYSAESGDLSLNHNFLEGGIVEGKAPHKLYFAAHGRIVTEYDLGQALGLTSYCVLNDSKYVYAGVLSGDFFDKSVNSERTFFDLEADTIDQIKRHALEQIRSALAPQIERVINQQAELTRNVIKKYPRYSYLVDSPRSFAEKKVPRNYKTAEQIYQQLALYDFRENRDLEQKVETLSKQESPADNEAIDFGVKSILEKISAQETSVVADYTVRRKVVLDLLEKRLGYKPDGSMKHHSEEALHKFVVPMRVENYDISIDDHNLWIVDDKLAYYEYWASDKK